MKLHDGLSVACLFPVLQTVVGGTLLAGYGLSTGIKGFKCVVYKIRIAYLKFKEFTSKSVNERDKVRTNRKALKIKLSDTELKSDLTYTIKYLACAIPLVGTVVAGACLYDTYYYQPKQYQAKRKYRIYSQVYSPPS